VSDAARVHHDDMPPGLGVRFKKLSTKTVTRAATPAEVIPVCLAHNLRQGNEEHRHRSRIHPERAGANEVIRGSGSLEAASATVVSVLDELGIAPKRRDAVMAIEFLFQPPIDFDRPKFWAECLAWMDGRYQHIASAIIHRDQKAAHMHVIALAVSDGRLVGNEMTSGKNHMQRQVGEFYAHMRAALGLRKVPKVKTLAELAVSAGKGAKTRSEAAKSDAEMAARFEAKKRPGKSGKGSNGKGSEIQHHLEGQPLATPKTPTPLIGEFSSAEQEWRNLFEMEAWEDVSAGAEKAWPGAVFLRQFQRPKDGRPVAPLMTQKKPQKALRAVPPEPPKQAPPAEHVDHGEAVRIREGQDAKLWCTELGEFVDPPPRPARPARASADSWVAAALSAGGLAHNTKQAAP
jgi:hypothetical protein